MSRISPDTLQNWDLSSRLEWLATNGIGGYASSSLAGANTRRYHGLLVAACKPPLGRTVILSKLEEEIRIEDQVYFLSANKYPSIIYPQGYRHLVDFSDDPVATFNYAVHEDTVHIQKQIWMGYGTNTVYVQYTVTKAPEPLQISLSPFMAYKDYHTEQRRWGGFTGTTTVVSDAVAFVAYDGAIGINMRLNPPSKFAFQTDGSWYYNYEHEREQERGLNSYEDLYCPGHFKGIVSGGDTITFVASLEDLHTLLEVRRWKMKSGAGKHCSPPQKSLRKATRM